MELWIIVNLFLFPIPCRGARVDIAEVHTESWKNDDSELPKQPVGWSPFQDRTDARLLTNVRIRSDFQDRKQFLPRKADNTQTETSLYGEFGSVNRKNESQEISKVFVPSSRTTTSSDIFLNADKVAWDSTSNGHVSKKSFHVLKDNFTPVDLSLQKITPSKENFQSPEFSGTRSRWKKQSKDKKGNGGHWVEYDFDEGTSTTTVDSSLPENPVGLKNPTLLVGPWVEEPRVRKSKAYFGGQNNTLVNAQIDTTANLPCAIFNRDDHETVSWIRSRDHHLITVGRQTYSSDNRFTVNFNRHLSWTLHLRYVQPRDAGEYICQLSTDPAIVYIVSLSVTAEATSVIKGGGERYVHEGSSVRLECSLQNHTQLPDYVFWYHNGTMINYDINRKVKVESTPEGSALTLLSVGRTDSGNYTCSPANAKLASITLHIILGDTLAAMKVSGSAAVGGSLVIFAELLVLHFSVIMLHL